MATNIELIKAKKPPKVEMLEKKKKQEKEEKQARVKEQLKYYELFISQ